MNSVGLWLLPAAMVLCASWSHAEDTPVFLGNGGLTIRVLPSSVVDSVYWPAPGTFPQTNPASVEDAPPPGFLWGVVIDRAIIWLSDPEWERVSRHLEHDVLETSLVRNINGVPCTVTVQTFLHPRFDMLFSVCKAASSEPVSAFVWRSAVMPVAKRLPETQPGSDITSAMRNFAAYRREDPAGIVQFRPRGPGRADWELARNLTQNNSDALAWRQFGPGTYIGTASPSETAGIHWVSPQETVVEAGDWDKDETIGIVGAQASIQYLEPVVVGSEQQATMSVSFADSVDTLDKLTAFGALPVSENLLGQIREGYDRAAVPLQELVGDSEQGAALVDRYLTIHIRTDRRSGAAVNSLSGDRGYSDALLEAWCAAALDVIGLHDEAEGHLRFLQRLVQISNRTVRPLGSLPAQSWTTGHPAGSD